MCSRARFFLLEVLLLEGKLSLLTVYETDDGKSLTIAVLKPGSASKTEKITTTNKIEKSRIWLNLTNTGAFKHQ
jgi:hypothetical protein